MELVYRLTAYSIALKALLEKSVGSKIFFDFRNIKLAGFGYWILNWRKSYVLNAFATITIHHQSVP